MTPRALRLELRDAPWGLVDAGHLRPDALAGLAPDDVARLPLRVGARRVAVGDLFAVRGEAVDADGEVVVSGDLRRVNALGAGLRGGRLLVEGHGGAFVGADVEGGAVEVRGDVGPLAGSGMTGGRLTVLGDAGDRLAAGRTGERAGTSGGEVLVHGDAGEDCGASMRRGLVAVAGRIGPGAGLRMLAGTVVALGGLGGELGAGNKRGSLVDAAGDAAAFVPPPGYRYATTFAPPALRLQLVHLRRLGLPVDDALLGARFARFSGDLLEVPRGEILVRERA